MLIVVALALSAATVLASALWMIAARPPGPEVAVELGFSNTYVASERAERVDGVASDSPAERAGLRTGDRITAVDGQPLDDASAITWAWSRHQAGDDVRLTVLRAGAAAPLELRATFRMRPQGPPVNYFARQAYDLFPVPFVIVGLAVLFLRIEDRNAWLLALLFACMVQTPGVPGEYAMFGARLRAFALAHSSISIGLVGPIFYFFFAVFPERCPLERRWPWLKWAAVAVGLALALPGVGSGGLRLPPRIAGLAGETLSSRIPIIFVIACFALGLAALTANFVSTRDPEARRKIRVILWGTSAGILPALTSLAVNNFTSFRTPAAAATIVPLVMFLLPASFAYAVVKHRVLEIPVLIRRSARYLLVQRGFMLLVSVVSIGLTLLFASWFTRYLPSIDQSAGILLGAGFGTALLWSGLNVQRRVSERIDRAFFRSAYDVRVILEDLAAKTGMATDREAIACLLERHLVEALRPAWLMAYLERRDGSLVAAAGAVSGGPETLAASDAMLARLAERGRPWDCSSLAPGAAGEATALADLGAECLVPILGRGRRLVGLIALGRRLSDEPYSGEDLRLLASVAGQTGTALDNIRLAEDIAHRMESERRAAHEMDIARKVQARLLPDAAPPLATLDCAARCVQARDVGGDGYDFLDLGPGRVGFVLADVSGKGIHAALLMANLQAHIRSQSGIAPLDPVRVLSEVNRLLFGSTATEHYATVFLGIYDDQTRRLRYVNGGLNPPVLLPRGAGAEPVRLMPTAPAIGLFDEWQGAAAEIVIDPGDLLALFSDGVTEAMRGEDEFGEARFIEELSACRDRPATVVVETILASVQQFSGGTQSDDLTLVVASGIPGGRRDQPVGPVMASGLT
jgi:sigma-B regulation protein RsbU (phosphoserine phosphatase)